MRCTFEGAKRHVFTETGSKMFNERHKFCSRIHVQVSLFFPDMQREKSTKNDA